MPRKHPKDWRKQLHSGTSGERLIKYGLLIAVIGIIALVAVPLIKMLGYAAILVGIAILVWGFAAKQKEKPKKK